MVIWPQGPVRPVHALVRSTVFATEGVSVSYVESFSFAIEEHIYRLELACGVRASSFMTYTSQ